ncbi:MAG: hypothetical protein IH788_02650 [Nitrospinae bacterium]|nr:hypothetical protein [Nitrospinota bacterium]
MVIWRYNSDGTLDTTFDTDGIVVHDSAAGSTGSMDFGSAIALGQAIGNDDVATDKILVAGTSFNAAGNADMVIWRYNP